MGLFDKLKEGLRKTTRLLNTDIRDLFKGTGRLIDDAFLDELYVRLIKTDMGVTAAGQIIEEVRTDFRGRVVEMADILAVVKKKLKSLLAGPSEPLRLAA